MDLRKMRDGATFSLSGFRRLFVMDPEDEVVGEVDLYLSRRLQPSLHVFQFPISLPHVFNSEESPHFRAKPTHKKFELEVPMDLESKHFDSSKGEQIAYIANSAQTGEKYFEDGIMNKQVLKSIEVVPALHQYTVGILSDDNKELHLTPVNSVLQFRPSFEYFDKSQIRVKKGSVVGKEESDVSDHEETDVKRIPIRFAGPDEERLKKARESSYAFLKQQVDSEAWVDVSYFSKEDIKAHNERCRLLYNMNEEQEESQSSIVNPVNNVEGYLKHLVAMDSVEQKKPSEDVNIYRQNSSTVALSDEIRKILLKAKVLSLNDIKQFIAHHHDEPAVLRYLQQYGMLIQGNWVVKSEILYPKEEGGNNFSPLSGIPNEILCRARDYVMWCFTQSTSVSRQEILKTTKVPDEDVLAILTSMATYKRDTKLWDFLLPTDQDFIDRHPDIFTRQTMLWKARRESLDRIGTNLTIKKERGVESIATFSSPMQIPRKRRRSRRDSSASGTDDNESSGSELFGEHSGNKMKPEKRRKIESPKSHVSNQAEVKMEQKSRLATFEVKPGSAAYPSFEEKRLLLQFITSTLKEHFCLTLESLRMLVSEGKQLNTAVSDSVLENLVIEAGGFRVQNKWPQKKEPRVLLAFKKFGDQHDKIRDILFEMFSEQARIRVTHFKEKVKDVFGDSNCDSTCKKLLKEYCVMKSGTYYLKGTID